MFLSNTSNYALSLSVTKHLAEIALRDNMNLLVKLIQAKYSEVEAFGRSIREEHPYVIIRQFLKEVLRATPADMKRFGESFSISLQKFNVSNLLTEYLSVPVAEEEIKITVVRMLETKYKDIEITAGMWTSLYMSIKKFVGSRFSGYDSVSGGIIPFLVHGVSNYYMKSLPNDIEDLILSFGLNQENESSDFGMIDYQKEEYSDSADLTGFDTISKEIHAASALLFDHNGKVMYDLFSRYKKTIVEERAQGVRKIIEKKLPNANSRTPVITKDPNLKIFVRSVSASLDTANKKLSFRNMLIQPLDGLVSGSRGITEIGSMVREMISINNDKVLVAGGKDKLPLFDYGNYVSRDKTSNEDKVEIIVTGFLSLAKFVKFLNENDIDPLTVPSDSFRDPKFAERADSFRWYMASLEITKELIAGESNNWELVPNNTLYESMENPNSDVFKSISLGQIKTVLEKKTDMDRRRFVHEPFLNMDIIMTAVNKLDKTAVKGVQRTDLLLRYLIEEVSYPQIQGTITKFIARDEAQFYVSKINASIEDFFKGFHKENIQKVNNSMNLTNRSLETGNAKFIGYLRIMSIIGGLLDSIKGVMSLIGPASVNQITSEFSLMLALSGSKKMLPFPVNAKNISELSHLFSMYNTELYLTSDTDIDKLNEQAMRVFSELMKDFGPYLKYCNNLYSICETKYFKPMPIELGAYDVPEHLMRSVGVKLHKSPESDLPRFLELKGALGLDPSTGFLMRGKKHYTREEGSVVMYLHERGYWVRFKENGEQIFDVKEEHFQ